MRLWSLHPKYLDPRGLVALWRETLLARKVLQGKTRGYKHHPQLIRFRNHPKPLHVMAAYLHEISLEAKRRGYKFKRVPKAAARRAIPVTRGQVSHEWRWLRSKLRVRDKTFHKASAAVREVQTHPVFYVVSGARAHWEKSAQRSKISA